MLDIKRIRLNPNELKNGLQTRNKSADVDGLLALDEKRRQLMTETETLKAHRNATSAEIPRLKKAGQDTTALMNEMKAAGERVKALEAELRTMDEAVTATLLGIPNIPHPSVESGADDSANRELRKNGAPRTFAFDPKPHWDVGTGLGILDFEMGARVTGTRFVFYKGLGARLERAVINFFMDSHAKAGYTEVFPPFMANRASMTGTGQLPKFEEDMFHVEGTEYFMIPTAEVPVTNMYRDQILDAAALPICYCAYSACFRAEAGAAGRDTRGLIRQHQFNKVELVKFVQPENSYDELESLTARAEFVLEALGLSFRVVQLCGGDLGHSSAKTYDIEVWMPSYGRYVEISSCSNFEDYQARRANIRFRRGPQEKPEFAHTLNGSGVAVGRTVAAILENFQREDGSVDVPQVLIPYMGIDVIK